MKIRFAGVAMNIKIFTSLAILVAGSCKESNSENNHRSSSRGNSKVPAEQVSTGKEFPFKESLLRNGGTMRIESNDRLIPTFYIDFPKGVKGFVPVYTEDEWGKREGRISLSKVEIIQLFGNVESVMSSCLGEGSIGRIRGDRGRLDNLTEKELFEYDADEKLRNELSAHYILRAFDAVLTTLRAEEK